jgi:hypothetical protein
MTCDVLLPGGALEYVVRGGFIFELAPRGHAAALPARD